VRTQILRDDASGLELFEERRPNPGGEPLSVYSFSALSKSFPEHLQIVDHSDRNEALRKFDLIVAWLKVESKNAESWAPGGGIG
jgi:hypothetical protein